MNFYEMKSLNHVNKDHTNVVKEDDNYNFENEEKLEENNFEKNDFYTDNKINKLQEILFEDESIQLTKEYIKIHKYYYPLKKEKIIPLFKIKNFSIFKLTRFTGKYKFFGLNWDLSWFHLDNKRPQKEFGIKINDGSLISIVITPNNPHLVYDLISSIIKK